MGRLGHFSLTDSLYPFVRVVVTKALIDSRAGNIDINYA